jgi:phage gp36-like protein
LPEPYKTLISTSAAFATGDDLIVYRDWRHVGDLLNDDDTRPGSSDEVSGHDTVAVALKTATAEIENAVYRGNRYTRADLEHLVGDASVASNMLKQLTCDLAFWILVKRRKPDALPAAVAGVQSALNTVEALRLGEAIFPFFETADSAAMDIAPFDSEQTKSTYVYEPISRTSVRMFGTRSRDLRGQ